MALAGPYNLGDCWDALNPLTKGGYVFYTKSADETEAKRKAYTLNLEGVLGRVPQPMLVIHGAMDRLFPPSHAERIARAGHGIPAGRSGEEAEVRVLWRRIPTSRLLQRRLHRAYHRDQQQW